MPSRFDPPPDPKPQPSEMLPLDLTKRYDVYCSPHAQPTVVYRDVLFKRERCIFVPKDQFDRFSHYVELELPDGRPVFVSRMSIIAFCEAGSTLGYESSRSSPSTA
jgi:hypothetical protein